MIDIQAIVEKLNDILKDITGVKAVYSGIPPYNAKFPCITIRPLSWEEEWGDLSSNIENDTFVISVFVQLEQQRLDSQEILIELVKQVREELGKQENITLNNLVDSMRLNSGNFIFASKESNLYLCEINVNVRKRAKRFNCN